MVSEKLKQKYNAAYLSIAANAGLTVFKLIVGILAGSISIIAECLHSLNDLLASFIATYAIKESAKPPDEKHRYGHGKAESISALLEAVLIIFAAVFIIQESYSRILFPHAIDYIELGIGVMLVSTVLNTVVAWYLYRTTKKAESAALQADAAHHATDVLTSLGVFLGLIAIRFTGINLLDPAIAILVSVIIIYTGAQLVLGSTRDLMDTKLSAEDEGKICEILRLHGKEFLEFHRLRTRKSGSERHIDLHLVVPKEMSVDQGHTLADHVVEEIKISFPEAHVLIHIEPCERDCDGCPKHNDCKNRTFLSEHVKPKA